MLRSDPGTACYSPNVYLFFSPFLLKTFSINPFQGQYPNIAVRINPTPINPIIHRKIPEMKKTRSIDKTPMIKRKILSPFPTFVILIRNPILPSLSP
jgi:hypothetical protein